MITGANQGIGKTPSNQYRAADHTVTGTVRDSDAEIALNVADPAQQTAMAAQLQDCPVDLLICNAGVYLDRGHDISHQRLSGREPNSPLWVRSKLFSGQSVPQTWRGSTAKGIGPI